MFLSTDWWRTNLDPLAKREPKAVAEFTDAYLPIFAGWVRRRSRRDCEDLVQDAWLKRVVFNFVHGDFRTSNRQPRIGRLDSLENDRGSASSNAIADPKGHDLRGPDS